MQMIDIDKLLSHPRNHEFFDDIEGSKWEDFKQSVVRRGIVESIVVTQDLMIVSGHQRTKACRELGILAIPCRITHYPDIDPQTKNSKEDQILEDLICTNIMQRGVGNVNPMKLARCIVELERIYEIEHGGDRGNQHSRKEAKSNNFTLAKTQEDIAQELGITKQQLHNYKKLLTLIPELQYMVEEQDLKATTATLIAKKLKKEEQKKLLEEVGIDQLSEMTQREVSKQIEKYIKEIDEIKEEKKALLDTIESLKEQNPIIETIEKEFIPGHLTDELTTLREQIKEITEEKINLEEYIKSDEYEILSNERKEELLKQQERLTKTKAHIDAFELKIKINSFIKEASPDIYLQGAMSILDQSVKKDMLEALAALKIYCVNLENVLYGNIREIKNVIEYN